MPDRSHIGLVDAHAERRRGHDHAVGRFHEACLTRIALAGGQARVVGLGRDAALGEALRHLLAARAGARVDHGGPSAWIAEAALDKRPASSLVRCEHDIEGEVGSVEAGAHTLGVAQRQRASDVIGDLRRRRRGQRHRRARTDLVPRRSKPQVVGAKVVPPLRQAVRLIDGEERDIAPLDQLAEARVGKPLGCDQQEPARAIGDRVERRAHVLAPEARVEHASLLVTAPRERVVLVAHEGDQRRDDERQPVHQQAGQLVAERLPLPRRHHDERVAPLHRGLDRLTLAGAEHLEAEPIVQLPRELVHLCTVSARVTAIRGHGFAPSPAASESHRRWACQRRIVRTLGGRAKSSAWRPRKVTIVVSSAAPSKNRRSASSRRRTHEYDPGRHRVEALPFSRIRAECASSARCRGSVMHPCASHTRMSVSTNSRPAYEHWNSTLACSRQSETRTPYPRSSRVV